MPSFRTEVLEQLHRMGSDVNQPHGFDCVIFIRKLWLGGLLAVAIAASVFYFAIPPYLAWIHGPKRPRFPVEDTAQARMLNDLRLIDTASQNGEPSK